MLFRSSYDYVETLGLELVAGRSLSRAFATDSLAVLLNETAVRQLGLDDPLGKQLVWPDESTYTIVGVLKDFHITSLHRQIGAVALLVAGGLAYGMAAMSAQYAGRSAQ